MVNMSEKFKKTTGASHTQSQDVVIFCTQTKKRKRTKMMNTLALFLHRENNEGYFVEGSYIVFILGQFI